MRDQRAKWVKSVAFRLETCACPDFFFPPGATLWTCVAAIISPKSDRWWSWSVEANRKKKKERVETVGRRSVGRRVCERRPPAMAAAAGGGPAWSLLWSSFPGDSGRLLDASQSLCMAPIPGRPSPDSCRRSRSCFVHLVLPQRGVPCVPVTTLPSTVL